MSAAYILVLGLLMLLLRQGQAAALRAALVEAALGMPWLLLAQPVLPLLPGMAEAAMRAGQAAAGAAPPRPLVPPERVTLLLLFAPLLLLLLRSLGLGLPG